MAGKANRLTKPSKRSDSAHRATKSYHLIDLVPVEIAMRGFFTYFVEDRAVFEEAHDQSLRLFLNHDTGELAPGRTAARPRSLARCQASQDIWASRAAGHRRQHDELLAR